MLALDGDFHAIALSLKLHLSCRYVCVCVLIEVHPQYIQ